jgi:hypothetical protein
MNMDYPAGVTNRTIDEHFGERTIFCPKCDGYGKVWIEGEDRSPSRWVKCTCDGGRIAEGEVVDDGDEE